MYVPLQAGFSAAVIIVNIVFATGIYVHASLAVLYVS